MLIVNANYPPLLEPFSPSRFVYILPTDKEKNVSESEEELRREAPDGTKTHKNAWILAENHPERRKIKETVETNRR